MNLSKVEIATRDKILAEKGYNYLADLEATAEGSRSYHYEVHPSNIGDFVFLVYQGEKHMISDINSF